MKKITYFIPVLLAFSFFSCRESAPVAIDGTSTLKLVVGKQSADGSFQKIPNAKVILVSEYGTTVKYTDQDGNVTVDQLPASTYSAGVRQKDAADNSIMLVGNIKDICLNPGCVKEDTIFVKSVSSSGIAINELYVGGPVVKDYYFYDQYIELYNSSDEIKYLDGMIVARVNSNGNPGQKGPGADEGSDGDIDGASTVYKFPGKPGEKNYPFYPHTFLVLAASAQNHKAGHPTSVDLSGADWEFYNQYSSTDIDNPKAQNLINMNSNMSYKFMVSLTSDVIAITDGKDENWSDGLDISGIIDAVEYDSKTTSPHTIDPRVDKGYIVAPVSYSGKSMQRKEPGIDTNDGSLDWEVISAPTPGYQK